MAIIVFKIGEAWYVAMVTKLLSSYVEVRWPHGLSALVSGSSGGFEAWPETLCCVPGQDTLLSQCLSPPRCINGCWQI